MPGASTLPSVDFIHQSTNPSIQPGADRRYTEANRRLPIVQAFDALLQAGCSTEAAALQLRQKHTTLWRWHSDWKANGYEGLLPKTDKCGRKSTVTKLRETLGPETVDNLLKDAKATAADTQSVTMGFRLIAKRGDSPEIISQLADYAEHGGRRSSKHALPPSIRDALRITKPEQLAHRGPRALALGGMWTPRKLDILPGDVWTSDDTTPIWGWWVDWPHAKNNPAFPKASCEFKFGKKLLQGQLLPLMDVASNYIFSFALIARETAGYRASDIWALFGRAFEIYGLPRLGFQLERGSWESNLIRGVDVEVHDGEVSYERRIGGLRMLPTNVTAWHKQTQGDDFNFPKTLQTWTSYLPKSKPIEAAFDRMQTLEGTIWGCLGRDQMRRPNEKAKKLHEACRRGAADPGLHFLSGLELVARLKPILEFLNDEPMEGQVFKGVPRLLHDAAISDYPLFRLPEDQHYLFARAWHVTRITSGWAKVKINTPGLGTRTEYYSNPSKFAAIEGKPVIVYYDPESIQQSKNPSIQCPAPAAIHDAKTSDFICLADWFERPGMFLGASQDGHDIKKLYREAVTTLYADIAARAPSRQLPAEIAARRAESKSVAAEVTRLTPPASSATSVPLRCDVQPPSTRANLSRQAEIANRLREMQT